MQCMIIFSQSKYYWSPTARLRDGISIDCERQITFGVGYEVSGKVNARASIIYNFIIQDAEKVVPLKTRWFDSDLLISLYQLWYNLPIDLVVLS